jgi:hypothetical protein
MIPMAVFVLQCGPIFSVVVAFGCKYQIDVTIFGFGLSQLPKLLHPQNLMTFVRSRTHWRLVVLLVTAASTVILGKS